MDSFIQELPALIITLAVLAMATVLIIYAHVNIADALAIVSPAIAFWFIGKAYSWQPTPAAPHSAITQPMPAVPPTNASQPPV